MHGSCQTRSCISYVATIMLTIDEEIWDMLLTGLGGWHKGGDGGICLSK